MFSTILQEIKGVLGRDFILVVFLPILFLTIVSLGLFLEIRHGLVVELADWEKLPFLTQMIALTALMVSVTVVSFILYNFQASISRLFEGYWARIPVLHTLRNPRVTLYRRRYDCVTEQANNAGTVTLTNEIIAEQLKFYPPPNHVDKMMPTRFGNVLRATEIYAFDRYGIDLAVIWSRLRPLLAPEAISPLENIQIGVDFSLILTILSAGFSLIWCPVLALFTNRWGLFLACSLGWPLAWLSYHNAMQGAVAYREQLAAIFDLYRHNLLIALKRPLPETLEEERKEWLRVGRFFYRNVPLAGAKAPPGDDWQLVARNLADYLASLTSKSVGAEETKR
jgi:hypothetical protein